MLFDKLKNKIINLNIKDSVARRAVERTLEKNKFLKGGLDIIKKSTSERSVQNELFRIFIETQGTLIESKEHREKIMLFLDKVTKNKLKKDKKYKKFVQTLSTDGIVKGLKEIEELQALIEILDLKNSSDLIYNALATSLKNQRTSSLSTFVNKTFLVKELNYFTEINKINFTYENLIIWALTGKKPKAKKNSKLRVNLTPILITIIHNIFKSENTEISQNNFIVKAGALFLKLYYINSDSKKEAKEWFAKYSEKDTAKIGEFILGLFQTGGFLTSNETKKKRENLLLKETNLKLNSQFVEEVFNRLFNVQSYPSLCPTKDWGLIPDTKALKKLVSQRDYITGDEERSSYLKVSEEALQIINNMQKTAFKIDKNLLNYIIENLDLLFKQQKITFLNFTDYNEYINYNIENFHAGVTKEFLRIHYIDEHNKELARFERILDTVGKAILLENEEFYFTALLDFRGRCYFHSYGLGIQEYMLGRSLIKMKSSVEEEIHLDVKSSVLQIILAYLNDPFNKLHLTNLYEGEHQEDIYEAGIAFIKKELNKISPKITMLSSPVTGQPYINRSLFKMILMKNLYSQSYQGLVTEFKRDYAGLIKDIKKQLDNEENTIIKEITTQEGHTYKKKYIKAAEEFALVLNPKSAGFDAAHLIPGLATKYINENFPELLIYKKFFQVAAKINGDRPLHLTEDQALTPMQYYTLKEETKIPTTFSKYNKSFIRILVEAQPIRIDLKKTIRSTGVNFTHATDALIMFKTLQKMQAKKISLAPIHDSFRIEKKFTKELNSAYKESLNEIIFKQDLLKDFYVRILNNQEKSTEETKELAQIWSQIEKYREMGAKHKKIYRQEVLALETKNHVKVGFLEEFIEKT